MFDFTGKVALVTGASAGIGAATAHAFANAGAQVVLADINDADGTALAEQLNAEGGTAIYVHADMGKADDVREMVAKTLESFGALHMAFNNAGIVTPTQPLHEIADDAWDRVIDVNLKGVWLCMKHEIPAMIDSGGGAIVNASSVLGLVGTAGLSPYVAAKHGVLGLTRTAAQEYAGHGIRVNCVNPGWIKTDMTMGGVAEIELIERLIKRTPARRWGQAEEIAAAVLWLCSAGASFVTGTSLAIDGGLTSQ